MTTDGAREILELEHADRLEEAAELAARLGEHAEAARLWERACRFAEAAAAWNVAGDPERALEAAARSGRPELEAAAIEALARAPESAHRVAAKLADLGRPRTAGRLLLAVGDAAAAAVELERAAAWLDAAAAHEQASDPRRAARCLETALAIDDGNQAARLALGRLLVRHGRHSAAARALQAIPPARPERREALPLLKSALASLGLAEGVREVEEELARLGLGPSTSSAPPPPALAVEGGQVLFGRYRIEADVATTPTARVFKARDTLTDSLVAVKLFSAATLREAGRDALVRFEREATVLGQLRHPAIVPLVAYVREGPAVVLAWMNGGSLADELARTTLSPARAVEIACAVLGALGEAHRRGILHRDIKPANVLFDDTGAAHLADFGTAHVADAAATVTAGVIGTLAYMAPEQRAGSPANAKSDVFGVGALLVHALTGAPPGGRLPYLSSELEPRHTELVERLVGPEAERPETALDARDLLRSLTWPTSTPAPRVEARDQLARADAGSSRLEHRGGVRYHDRVLEREILVLDAKGSAAERALAFARADHPGLASVLALRSDPESVWVEVVSGEPLSGTPTGSEGRWLTEALSALHRAGGWHGAVEPRHVVRRGGRLTLAFPLDPPGQDPASDFAGLAKLLASDSP